MNFKFSTYVHQNYTPKNGGKYSKGSADFIGYLEKENQGLISTEGVDKDIDGNGAKLNKTEPKFYSITVSPSK